MPRYLIIRPGAVGDAIVTLPVVQRLKSCLPDAQVELILALGGVGKAP